MTEKTKQYVIILIVTAVVGIVIAGFALYAYELMTGQAHLDASLGASLNGFIIAMLTTAVIVVNGIVSRRHTEQLNQSTQNIVHAESNDLKDKLANGFGTRIGQVAAQQVAAEVLPVALANQQAIEQIRQNGVSTSEHQASTDRNTASMDANTAQLTQANAQGVQAGQAAIHDQSVQANTAATEANTVATEKAAEKGL